MGKYEEALERARQGRPIDEVFPELKESEDERIIKIIINCLQHDESLSHQDVDDCITYLEKQKEQKPAEQPVLKFKVGDFVMDTNYQGNPIYEILSIDKSHYICEYRGDKSLGDRTVMHFSIVNPYLRLVQKPTNSDKPKEWNEEDEMMFTSIVDTLALTNGAAQMKIDWLKRLKDRVLIQSKSAEWSEEDKAKVVRYLHDRDGGMLWSKATEITRDILDMLRPSWKPSEEQMNRLVSIIAALRKDDCDDMADFLASLYHNLEKLM